jgi:YegS/Rv2252/BmrU family lipid kinase
MVNSKQWFVIINPTSGNGSAKKLWPKIEALLLSYQFDFKYEFTAFANHSQELVQDAINKGLHNIIGIGGDGTLHNIVNGIMSQNGVESTRVNVGVIPIGTGNDWVKTHDIPNDIEHAIQIIKNGITTQQDLGKIKLLGDSEEEPIYFNNLAGVGFDGYVVSKVGKYKHFGSIAYLVGTIMGLFSFKNFECEVAINSEIIRSKSLMVLIGLCQYSGGGMQLTKLPNPYDGLFDISLARDFSKWDILKNTLKLFNGSIVNFKKVQTFTTTHIDIKILEDQKPFVQADGELIGSGDFNFSIIPKALSFYCK